MSECSNECRTCKSSCKKICPICHGNANLVLKETVQSLLINEDDYIDDGNIYICLNRNCDVTYFNNSVYYVKSELKVPVWFKENPLDMIVCYCHKITFKMIIDAVKLGYNTKEEIIKYYQIKTKEDCIHQNPLGKSCDALFQNTIIYAQGERK